MAEVPALTVAKRGFPHRADSRHTEPPTPFSLAFARATI